MSLSPVNLCNNLASSGVNRDAMITPRQNAGVRGASNTPRKPVQSADALTPEVSPQAQSIDRVCVQLSELIGLDLIDARGLDLDREDIAAACGVSVARINKWAAPAYTDHLPPVQFLPLWIRATGSYRLVEWVANECDLHIVDTETLRLAELGRLALEVREREARMKQLMGEVA